MSMLCISFLSHCMSSALQLRIRHDIGLQPPFCTPGITGHLVRECLSTSSLVPDAIWIGLHMPSPCWDAIFRF
ncbi:uncharacterized protein F5891DRAFT_1019717 [Suillus fuscotomentosus]|uniref:Uncharacterized protein n=1 Tax=Suillus fuscotomentosus TaxID=1912939 RepID=A0AAD4EEG4_9AGAM|nr:uncharacterized protein F5891DRAFT_1019717 [Suillus fuscotomentosus]KAG1903484.1 hypothetical protein F5891DRAFT_1019717 [Suillus fuscotomentosus]